MLAYRKLCVFGLLGISLQMSSCNGIVSTITPEIDDSLSITQAAAQNTTTNDQQQQIEQPLQNLDNANSADTEENDIKRPAGWGELSHSNNAEPDYETVFPEDQVNRIDITVSAENWAIMQEDMTALYGEFGARDAVGVMGQPPGDNMQPPGGQSSGQLSNPPGGQTPKQEPGNMQGPGGGNAMFPNENPVWVEAEIEFEGSTWTNVGLRFKGNSSLMSAWRSGSTKLPLKLDFDEFEDDYPQIDDQRFYGFKQLSLSTNYMDQSFMRESIAYDILESADIPAANTAFYQVYIDYGQGTKYLGLYTMIEVVDDTTIERVFGDDNGNIYEGDGNAASLAYGTFEQLSSSFLKENNEDEGDWSDIETLYNALHDTSRTTDPAAWRAGLEAVFDVDLFLKWLAVNQVIENWDIYGQMAHNFYLYHDPETDLLTWIPWDQNESLNQGQRSYSISLEDVDEQWPLINFLIADEIYATRYRAYVEWTVEEIFNPETMTKKFWATYELIQPYATQEISINLLENAVSDLVAHTEERTTIALQYLQD